MIGLSAAEDSSTSTTESTVELPIEIHGEIIDCLDIQHDAHDTTANCAFVRGTSCILHHISVSPTVDVVGYLGVARKLCSPPKDNSFFDREKTKSQIEWGKGQGFDTH